ncbi:hypothetical protein ABK040_002035 [Willaertia magna]
MKYFLLFIAIALVALLATLASSATIRKYPNKNGASIVDTWSQVNHDASQTRYSSFLSKHPDFFIRNNTHSRVERQSTLLDSVNGKLIGIVMDFGFDSPTLVSVDLMTGNSKPTNLQVITEIPSKYQPDYENSYKYRPVLDNNGNYYIGRVNKETEMKTVLQINTKTKQIRTLLETNYNLGTLDYIGDLLFIEEINGIVISSFSFLTCINVVTGKTIWTIDDTLKFDAFEQILRANKDFITVKTKYQIMHVNITDGAVLRSNNITTTEDWTLVTTNNVKNNYLFLINRDISGLRALAYDINTLKQISNQASFFLKHWDGSVMLKCSNYVGLNNGLVAALCRAEQGFYVMGIGFNEGIFYTSWSVKLNKGENCALSLTSDLNDNIVFACNDNVIVINGNSGFTIKRVGISSSFIDWHFEDRTVILAANGKLYLEHKDDNYQATVFSSTQVY